jgi:ATP-dependent Clp protease adapter protein ClpS
MPDDQPTTAPALDAEIEIRPDPGWKVILYNDDITPFPVVIFALMRAAGLSSEVAEMVAMEAHTTGSALVRRGLLQAEAEVMCGRLQYYSRVNGVCSGVDCEAMRDDA